jgi:hypothetical protein
LLDLAGWPALPRGWWLCAVGRPTQKGPYFSLFRFTTSSEFFWYWVLFSFLLLLICEFVLYVFEFVFVPFMFQVSFILV